MCWVEREIVYYKNITTKRDKAVLRKIYLKRVEEVKNAKPYDKEIMKDYQFYNDIKR